MVGDFFVAREFNNAMNVFNFFEGGCIYSRFPRSSFPAHPE